MSALDYKLRHSLKSDDVQIGKCSDVELITSEVEEEVVPPEREAGDTLLNGQDHLCFKEFLRCFHSWTESQASALETLSDNHQRQIDEACERILTAVHGTVGGMDILHKDFDSSANYNGPNFDVTPIGRPSVRASIKIETDSRSVDYNGSCASVSAVSATSSAFGAMASIREDPSQPSSSSVASSFRLPGPVSPMSAPRSSDSQVAVIETRSGDKKVKLNQTVKISRNSRKSLRVARSLDSLSERQSMGGAKMFSMVPSDSEASMMMLKSMSNHRRPEVRAELAKSVLAAASPALLDQLEEEKASRQTTGFKQVVTSPAFDYASALIIIAFLVMLGVETNYTSQHRGQSSTEFLAGTIFFNVWFTLEVCLRIAAERKDFLTSDDVYFNIIDAILVMVSVADLILGLVFKGQEHMAGSVSVTKAVRVIRVLRAVRIVRLVRAMRYVYQLRKMICLIAGCWSTLFWCLIILFGFIFTFAVFFTQGVTDHFYQDGTDEEEAAASDILQMYYGSLPRSISSLFQAMSAGISWREAFEPLGDVGVFYSACFMMYMTLSLFGVVNVMTSVFVESTMKSALAYRDLITTDVERMKKIVAEHLQGVFRSIDLNRDGFISLEEMMYFLADPSISGYLEALDINLHDARALFQLLDSDASGFVDIDEFIDGCMKLKGDAKAFDVHCLICEMTRFFKRWSKFTEYVVTRFNTIESVHQHVMNDRRSMRKEWDREEGKTMKLHPQHVGHTGSGSSDIGTISYTMYASCDAEKYSRCIGL